MAPPLPCSPGRTVTHSFSAQLPALYSGFQVMSASTEPRLAGRQPSVRGGVPRVKTGRVGMHAGTQARAVGAVYLPPGRLTPAMVGETVPGP